MMYHRIAVVLLVLLLAGCAVETTPNPDASASVALNTSAILARQTSDSANARSAALSAQATAAKQATDDAQARRVTDAAITLEFLRVTGTAQARLDEGANLQKTEVARNIATYTAEARAVTAAARLDAQTAEAAEATQSARTTATRRAEAYETATATAAVPTQIALAQTAEDARAERERQRMLELERYRKEMEMAPYLRAVELLMPFCVGLGLVLVLAFGISLASDAAKKWMESRALQSATTAVAGIKLITDAAGNPLGYLAPVAGSVMFHPIQMPQPEYEDEIPPISALLVSGGTSPKPAELPPPPEPLVGELIHKSELRVFLETILQEGNWTQDRWANVRLPRGYTLSMDTVNAQGAKVPGGYSQLLNLLVEHHLIVDRGAKRAGRWNPNAPTDMDAVMAILTHDARLPELPVKPNARRAALP